MIDLSFDLHLFVVAVPARFQVDIKISANCDPPSGVLL